jgi:hypothetical protein
MTERYEYVKQYRNNMKSDGFDYPIAICMVCKKIIKPSRMELSKTGSHGKFYYVHEHPLSFIILTRTNSGKRMIRFEGEIPNEIKKLVYNVWLGVDLTNFEVEDKLASYLETLER